MHINCQALLRRHDSVITQQLQLCLSSTAKFEAAAAQTADSCKRDRSL